MSAAVPYVPSGTVLSEKIPFNKTPQSPVKIIGMAIGYIVMILVAAFTLLPFVWMVLSSVKNNNEIFTVPLKWFPDVWHWENYGLIWQKADLLTWTKNTIILAVAVTILQIVTGSFAAYGFSKIKFAGRDVLFLCYIATMAVPWQSYMVPQFKMLSSWGLSDSLPSIILMQAFSAFGVFMMKQFYDTIPEELSEAARIDGLSEFSIYWKIILPLSGPSISALGIITFTNAWNEYMQPLIYLRSPELWTIQIGLKTFIGEYSASYDMIMTGSVLSVLPILVVFLFGPKYFIEGIATSGMKG